MPGKQTVNRRYNQFIYGGYNIGEIYRFNEETSIEFQYSQDYKAVLEKLNEIKSNECRAYHKFMLIESDDYRLKRLFAFFIFEVLLDPDILDRCMIKAEIDRPYFPTLLIKEIDRQIRMSKRGFKEFSAFKKDELEKQIEIFKEYLLMRFESYYLSEMLKNVHEDIILVCEAFCPEFLHKIPKNVKGIITIKEMKDLNFIKLLAYEYEIPIAQCYTIFPHDKIAIIDGDREKITFNPDEEDLKWFYEKYKNSTFDLGEIPTYQSKKIKIYAQVVNENNLDRVTSNNWYQGIAPFKTDFYFITKGILPKVEEQIEYYVDFFQKSNGMPIYLKVPDFTPDKPLKYMDHAHREIGFVQSQHQMFFDHFAAIAQAVKRTNADVKIVIPRIVMAEELSDWKRHLIMAFDYENIKVPEFGYILETESAYEYYYSFPKVDFVIIGFDNLIEEYSIHYDRYSKMTTRKFEQIFLPVIKDIHEHLNKRNQPTKHILSGNIISNPFIFRKLINYGFTEFSIPISKIRYIEPMFTDYCNTRGKYIGVYQQAKLKRKLKEEALKEKNKL